MEVVIKSHVKNIEGTDSYFEQRATNLFEERSYYFNQPVLMFNAVKENKPIIKDIVQGMRSSIEKCGIGLAHNQYHKQNDATNLYAIFIIV
ncbi:hypothetical protein BIY23_01675 [Wolbachia pipientis]|uniref:Uncharacterized protein n=1 Tax=Wolbachia pipientis TaxID=955 RepID=A0A1E7QLF1_WOLPI|nr:hypothetical protein [Wolbachia pipientis]OEY87166.1 hypothetical protein BIY23_01675 [Wolbachia pipientis]